MLEADDTDLSMGPFASSTAPWAWVSRSTEPVTMPWALSTSPLYRVSTSLVRVRPLPTSRTRCEMRPRSPSTSFSSAYWEMDWATPSATSAIVSANTSFTWYDTVSAPWSVILGATADFFSFE